MKFSGRGRLDDDSPVPARTRRPLQNPRGPAPSPPQLCVSAITKQRHANIWTGPGTDLLRFLLKSEAGGRSRIPQPARMQLLVGQA
jgi:hypothetical protein